jgi:hypothetical protein
MDARFAQATLEQLSIAGLVARLRVARLEYADLRARVDLVCPPGGAPPKVRLSIKAHCQLTDALGEAGRSVHGCEAALLERLLRLCPVR